MVNWDTFFAAQVGASAALAGLIFVGVSINMSRILSVRRLPERALQALIVLIVVLLTSSVLLVPGQPVQAAGVEVLLIGGVAWAFNLSIDLKSLQAMKGEYYGRYLNNTVLGQIALLPYVVGGILIAAFGGVGVYLLVPGVLLCFLKGLLDAWVLLVEINR